MQKGLKSHLAFTTSTDFGTTNFYRPIRECLESHLLSNHRQSFRTQSRPN